MKTKLELVCEHFIKKGKVRVKDRSDGKIKESEITAIYIDNTVILADCIETDYKISEITLI